MASVTPIHGHGQAQGEPANSHELEHLDVSASGNVNSNVHSNNSNQPTPTDIQPQNASNAVDTQPQHASNAVDAQPQNAPNAVLEEAQQDEVVANQEPPAEARSNEVFSLTRTKFKIIGLATLASVPMIILMSVFVGILRSNTVYGTSRVVLVRFQATRLLIPLQLAAIVAPFTIGILMKLWAYHVGRRCAEIPPGDPRALPHQPPSQRAMLIEYLFFPGGLTTIRSLGYALTPLRDGRFRDSRIARIFPGKGRSNMLTILPGVIRVLWFSAFFCFGLSLLVTVIQGVASQENYEQVTIIHGNLESFGRELPPNCAITYTHEINGIEQVSSCSLKPGPGSWIQAEPVETSKSLNNESSVNSILWDSQNEIAFLAPPVVNRSLDFEAATIGIHSPCTPKGKVCGLYSDTSNTIGRQTCPGLDFRDYNKPTSSLSLSQAAASAINFTGPGVANPFHYWIWVNVQADPSSSLPNDDEVLALDSSVSILLDCEITIVNYTYSFTNGTLTPSSRSSSGFTAPTNTTLVDNPTAEVFIDPLTMTFGMREIYERLRGYIASLSSAAAIADVTGRSVSETALGYAAGMFVKTEALEQSTREDMLVTRLPVALVVLCSLFGFIIAIEGLVLAVLAVVDVVAENGAVREINRMKLKALVERT